jgi:hypothetical protein
MSKAGPSADMREEACHGPRHMVRIKIESKPADESETSESDRIGG